MPEAVIIDAVRTPIGALGGALSAVRPDDLAAVVLEAIIERTGVDPAIVEEVYLGCANQAGEDNRNVARMSTLLAGFPVEVAAVTFNRLCASGLNAVNQAARAIRVGEGDVFVAGGVEVSTIAEAKETSDVETKLSESVEKYDTKDEFWWERVGNDPM